MCHKAMRRAATRTMASTLAACAALVVCDRRCRGAIEPDRDYAVDRLWPADGVHGWDESAGLVRSCTLLWNGGVHVGVQPREHTPTRNAVAGCSDGGQRSVAGLAANRRA
jgi:hypothetical protein